MTAFLLLLLCSPLQAQIRMIAEGKAATKDAIFVGTTTPRVGISTANPQATLDVNGYILGRSSMTLQGGLSAPTVVSSLTVTGGNLQVSPSSVYASGSNAGATTATACTSTEVLQGLKISSGIVTAIGTCSGTLSGEAVLTATQTFSGANTFTSSFTIRSGGRTIDLSTSPTSGVSSVFVATHGFVSIGTQSANFVLDVNGDLNVGAGNGQADIGAYAVLQATQTFSGFNTLRGSTTFSGTGNYLTTISSAAITTQHPATKSRTRCNASGNVAITANTDTSIIACSSTSPNWASVSRSGQWTALICFSAIYTNTGCADMTLRITNNLGTVLGNFGTFTSNWGCANGQNAMGASGCVWDNAAQDGNSGNTFTLRLQSQTNGTLYQNDSNYVAGTTWMEVRWFPE